MPPSWWRRTRMLLTYRGEDFGSAGGFIGSLVDCEALSRTQVLTEVRLFFVYKGLEAGSGQTSSATARRDPVCGE